MSKAAIARNYHVSTRWIDKLQKQREEMGDIAPLVVDRSINGEIFLA